MKLGDLLLTEKTRISVSLATLLFVIGSTATVVFTFQTIRADIEMKISGLQNSDIRIEQKFDSAVKELKETDDTIEQVQKEQSVKMAEIQNGQSELKEGQARIETNILWIMDAIRDDE